MIDFQRLRTSVNLVALIGQRVALRQRGPRWLGRCPFHDDHHPSLDVSPMRHVWRCWACGAGGDAVDWVRMTENCTTVEALRRLDGLPDHAPGPTLPAADPLATRAARHAAYGALLAAAGLAEAHRAALAARGLSDAAITTAEYGSLPSGGRTALLHAMRRATPDLRGVPGVARCVDHDRWQLFGVPGLLIPVRDRYGHIQACQIRADTGDVRYQWLSSAPRDTMWTGASPGTPFHVAGHRYIRRSSTWWVTEGPLKADVVSTVVQSPVMGIPGVALWPRLGRALAQWRPATIILAFDQDSVPETRQRVNAAQEALGAVLAEAGVRVFVAHWPEGPKGIDDALTAGAKLAIAPWQATESSRAILG